MDISNFQSNKRLICFSNKLGFYSFTAVGSICYRKYGAMVMIMSIVRKSYLSRVFENGSFQDVDCFDERRIYLAVLGL